MLQSFSVVCNYNCVGDGTPVKCGFADLRSGKMRRNTADVFVDIMGKMRMWQCGYATNEHMLLPTT